jgi:hypothetical protein
VTHSASCPSATAQPHSPPALTSPPLVSARLPVFLSPQRAWHGRITGSKPSDPHVQETQGEQSTLPEGRVQAQHTVLPAPLVPPFFLLPSFPFPSPPRCRPCAGRNERENLNGKISAVGHKSDGTRRRARDCAGAAGSGHGTAAQDGSRPFVPSVAWKGNSAQRSSDPAGETPVASAKFGRCCLLRPASFQTNIVLKTKSHPQLATSDCQRVCHRRAMRLCLHHMRPRFACVAAARRWFRAREASVRKWQEKEECDDADRLRHARRSIIVQRHAVRLHDQRSYHRLRHGKSMPPVTEQQRWAQRVAMGTAATTEIVTTLSITYAAWLPPLVQPDPG